MSVDLPDSASTLLSEDDFKEAIGLGLPFTGFGGPLLAERDFAELIGRSPRQVRELAERGLPRTKTGRRSRYPKLDGIHWFAVYSHGTESYRRGERGPVHHLDLAGARDVLMKQRCVHYPSDSVRVARSFADLMRFVPVRDEKTGTLALPELEALTSEGWPEEVTLWADQAELISRFARIGMQRLAHRVELADPKGKRGHTP